MAQSRSSRVPASDSAPACSGRQTLPGTPVVERVALRSMAVGSRADYVERIFSDPQSWATTALFDARRGNVQFVLGPDDFFPMGDNSPQSQDARVWTGRFPQAPPSVRRDLLTGKALLIYWPPPEWKLINHTQEVFAAQP